MSLQEAWRINEKGLLENYRELMLQSHGMEFEGIDVSAQTFLQATRSRIRIGYFTDRLTFLSRGKWPLKNSWLKIKQRESVSILFNSWLFARMFGESPLLMMAPQGSLWGWAAFTASREGHKLGSERWLSAAIRAESFIQAWRSASKFIVTDSWKPSGLFPSLPLTPRRIKVRQS